MEKSLEEERAQVDRLRGENDNLAEQLRIANLSRSESEYITHLKGEIDKLKNDLTQKESERKFYEDLVGEDDRKMKELIQEHADERK